MNEENLQDQEQENEQEQEQEQEQIIDYTTYLEDIISNQQDIISNQADIISNQESMLLIQADALDSSDKTYNMSGITATMLISTFLVILLIGACRYIKRIF